MQATTIRQLATRTALLLTLGLGLGACDKALDVQPQNSLDSTSGFTTASDAAAGLIGCYDVVQASSYQQVSYPIWGELLSGNARHVGTFTTTFGQAFNNTVSADNIEISNMWSAIYAGVERCNYLLQQTETIADPTFTAAVKATTQAETRALRAYHYMNLLAYWGGSTTGFGYTGGVGVPLRLIPVTSTTDATPIARSSEADVVAAIRADLDFAIANLSSTTAAGSFRITKNAALALRARLELWERNYADALKYAQQVPALASFATSVPSGVANDALWQLYFSTTDKNFMAFYFYPSANGGRNEFDPATGFAALHPAGDLRIPINAPAAPAGVTLKYTSVANGTDYFSCVRYAEVVLTIAEAAARNGDLITANAQLSIIRKRAGLPTVTLTSATALITEILLQRRLELAFEGQYWIDLRRTNTVLTAQPTFTQTFRYLQPIPQREVNLTNGLITQNTGY
jgi:hypothetical protein